MVLAIPAVVGTHLVPPSPLSPLGHICVTSTIGAASSNSIPRSLALVGEGLRAAHKVSNLFPMRLCGVYGKQIRCDELVGLLVGPLGFEPRTNGL